MKKRWIIALSAVAAVGLAVSFIVGSASQTAQVSVTSVQFGDFAVAVDITGEVRASEEYTVMPAINGRVKEVYVREGQQVKAGQKLFRIDDKDASSMLQQARYELQLALDVQEAEQEELRMQAQAQARAAEMEQQAIAAAAQAQLQGVRQAAEEVLAMAQNTGIDYHSLNRALSGQFATNAASNEPVGETGEETGEDLPIPAPAPQSKSDPRVSLAQERVSQAEYLVSQHLLVSESDGVVLLANVRVGEMVSAGVQAMVIGETHRPLIIAQIGERDLARIAIGQRVHMTVDGKTYNGRVSRTSPAAMRTAMSAQATGEVEVQPDAEFSAIVGATVEMSVEVANSSNTCRLPQECVLEENGDTFVYVIRNGAAKRRSVKLGLKDDFNVEIVEGVVMGERVVLSPAGLVDGQKVRVTA